ncbi:transglutaminase domain-containing protein [Dokdonia pacifica]|nr:transglutaminase domain-containing protein [Dokdonia pacifica]
MIKKYCFYIFLMVYAFAKAQTATVIDQKVQSYPDHINTITLLSNRIQNDFTTQEAQIRAIYSWIATHIAYDLEDYYSLRSPKRIYYSSKKERTRKLRIARTKLINETLKTQTALCEGYTALFQALCESLGIPCVTINGFTKTDSRLIGTSPGFKNHAWNAVYLDNEWHLIDVTWGAGRETVYRTKWEFIFNDHYYKVAPELFIKHHYPEDPVWQLRPHPISKKEFFSKPLLYSAYFDSGIHLSDREEGTIQLSKEEKYVYLHFEKLPKHPNVYYITQENTQPRPVRFKRHPSKGFIGKIKLKEKHPITLTLFNHQEAIIDFKVERYDE